MAEQHTAEPWEVVHHTPRRKTWSVRRGGATEYEVDIAITDEANARRIVAAVNACKGLTTVELERIDIGGLNKIVIALEATLK